MRPPFLILIAAASLVLSNSVMAGPPADNPAAAPTPHSTPAPYTGRLTPVPEQEVRLWAAGSTWCQNPQGDTCTGQFFWGRGRDGQFMEIGLFGLGQSDSDGIIAMTSPFELRNGQQCYALRSSDLRFATLPGLQGGGPNPEAATRFESEVRSEIDKHPGRLDCVAFFRDAEGRVRQRRYFAGAVQPDDPTEVFTVTIGRPDVPSNAI